MACAPSEDSDQPGHPSSLIRVYAVRVKKAWVLSYPLSAQRKHWSDWVDAQADLSLRWPHTHFIGFVMRWLKCVLSVFRIPRKWFCAACEDEKVRFSLWPFFLHKSVKNWKLILVVYEGYEWNNWCAHCMVGIVSWRHEWGQSIEFGNQEKIAVIILKFEQCVLFFFKRNASKRFMRNGKQCRPWSDCTAGAVWSGSTLFS